MHSGLSSAIKVHAAFLLPPLSNGNLCPLFYCHQERGKHVKKGIQLGAGKLTVNRARVEVSEAIRSVVYPNVAGIKDIPEVFAGFDRMVFPNCARAIDGTHMPIVATFGGWGCARISGIWSLCLGLHTAG